MNNRDEYIAGNQPDQCRQLPQVHPVSVSSPAQITFEAVSNKTYTVQYRDDLADAPWLNLTSIVARTNTSFRNGARSQPGHQPVLPDCDTTSSVELRKKRLN